MKDATAFSGADATDGLFPMLAKIIKAWNVDDEQGSVLAITSDTVRELWSEDAMRISNAVADANKRRSSQDDADFLSRPTTGSAESRES